jgi:anti-anti-sigma factor
LRFEVEERPDMRGVRVLAVRGELDVDTCGELRRRLEPRDGGPPPVVDLSDCRFIDSTGIGLLVRASRRAASDGAAGIVVVATPGSQVRKALRLTNVDSSIPVLGSLDAALGSAREQR